jgi:hypothetical protein
MRALSFIAIALLAGCTFDAEKPDFSATVTNISQSTVDEVDHLLVKITFADASSKTYQPTFQPQATTTVDLSFTTGETGAYTMVVEQLDHSANCYGAVTVAGTLPQTGTQTIDMSGGVTPCPVTQ